MNHTALPLPDQNQNYWQMASIQSAAFGLPLLYLSAQLGIKHGTNSAFISIFIGNLILWLIGLAIIAMTVQKRKNAIENLIEYIGKYGCLLGGGILSLAFLFWYPLQLRSATLGLKIALDPYIVLTDAFDLRVGCFLGLIISLLAVGGIRAIKWINVYALPLLIAFVIYALIKNASSPPNGSWELSISGIFLTVSFTLAGVVNVPTFFRHRKTKADAFLALSIFVIITALLECAGVLLINVKTNESFVFYLRNNALNSTILVAFIIVSTCCANLVNIYYASAVWEVIFPWGSKSKELAIIGIAGTLAFALFQARTIMLYLEVLFTSYIGILGVVIVVGYSIREVVKHRVRKSERIISFMCWTIGCITLTAIQNLDMLNSSTAFFSGVGVSVLIIITLLFVEETYWACKQVFSSSHQ